jgi:hypothetical protein
MFFPQSTVRDENERIPLPHRWRTKRSIPCCHSVGYRGYRNIAAQFKGIILRHNAILSFHWYTVTRNSSGKTQYAKGGAKTRAPGNPLEHNLIHFIPITQK